MRRLAKGGTGRAWPVLSMLLASYLAAALPTAAAQPVGKTDSRATRLVKVLRYGTFDLRFHQIYPLLESMGPTDQADAPVLLRELPGTGSPEKSYLLQALNSIGPAPVLQSLEAQQGNQTPRDPQLYLGALMALGQLQLKQGQVAPAVAGLTRALDEEDEKLRMAALNSLARLGRPAAPATQAIVRVLTEDDSIRSRQAAAALRQIQPLAPAAVQSLGAASQHRRAYVRRHAVWALAALTPPDGATVPWLLARLEDTDDDVRRQAQVALGGLGSAALPATQTLRTALQHDRLSVRLLAEQTLRRIAPDQANALLGTPFDPVQAQTAANREHGARPADWPQLAGSSLRNNTPAAAGLPDHWDVGGFNRQTGNWLADEAKNIQWVARLGTQSYGTLVVANGQVYVGTNNGAGYLPRYPANVDLGCLLCFREADGKFLWQHSSEKLATGRVHDWPLQGVCSTPIVQENRLWFVTNRGEVRCLDTDGFRDDENDGPYREEAVEANDEADVVWVFDMMGRLGVSQHNMATCSPTIWGNTLFICTSNGVDEGHIQLPSPAAPSFIALDKRTGELLWQDNSPGKNILHGQWASPAVGLLDGVPQVIFPGGDGWLYSFRADRSRDGKPELLWKFDCNPKTTKWIFGGHGTRNNVVAFPVIYDDLVYAVAGQDPEHGEGPGHLWCIDPTGRGDVSAELVVDRQRKPVPHRRIQAAVPWESIGEIQLSLADALQAGTVSPELRRKLAALGVALPKSCDLAKEIVGGGWLLTPSEQPIEAQYRLQTVRSDKAGGPTGGCAANGRLSASQSARGGCLALRSIRPEWRWAD